jgi:hypothetical protein
MDKKYVTLFRELAQATAASAETVMDYDREKGDEKGLETATIMRDDYQNLVDAISNDEYVPTQAHIAKLLVGAIVMARQLQDRINGLKTAMAGYQTDVIPKLQEILDNAKTDEEVAKMANEKFIIESNE